MNNLFSILLQILICGIATAAICWTIVYYDGPFHIFPRIRNSLLPESYTLSKTWDIQNIDRLQEVFGDILMDYQKSEGQIEMWKTYQTLYNHRFYQSLKGTLYAVLECPFCLGPYVSVFLASLSTIYMMLTQPIGWHNLVGGILVAFGSYGLHFIITKRWDDLGA